MSQLTSRWMRRLLSGFGMIAALSSTETRADPPLTLAPACIKRGWPATVSCASQSCFISSCGEGKCPYCFVKGLENVAIQGWAVYSCTSGESLTGKALYFLTTPFSVRLGPFCV